MRKLTLCSLMALTAVGITLVNSYAQAIEDFKPSSLNQPGKEYPMVNSEGRVRAQISAPDANYVKLDIGGVKYDLIKDENGVWTGESAPQTALESGSVQDSVQTGESDSLPFEANVESQTTTAPEPQDTAVPATSSKTDPLVIVVDTHAILYQVFHAMPPMTSPGGLPVGAIHGMLRDLLEIRRTLLRLP